MRNSCRGFMPQNDIIKLQWAVLEACQTEAVAQSLGILLRNTNPMPGADTDANLDDDIGQTFASS